MMRRAVAIVLTLLLLCGLAGCRQRDALRFGTGGVGGTYYAYGTALAQLISEENEQLSFAVKTTAGSAANLRLLKEGFLQLAVVQSDTLSDAVTGTGMFAETGPYGGYSAVAGLYCEACQIVVAADSEIESVYDLAGMRVSVGEHESGVLKNAEEILLSHGISFQMIEPVYLSFADSSAALEKGEIDAFFCTAGAPTNAVSELAGKMNIRLLPIADGVQGNMMKMYDGYTRYIIPANTYAGQTQEVSTIGVKAVLVASSDVKKDTVAYITQFLLENGDKLRYAANVPLETDLGFAVEDIPCGFHEGAAEYYASKGFTVDITSDSTGRKVSAAQD